MSTLEVESFIEDNDHTGEPEHHREGPSKREEKRPKMNANRICTPCRSDSGKTKAQIESWRCRSCRLKVCAHNSTAKDGDLATCWPCERERTRRIVIR